MMTENLIVFSHLDKHPEENTFFADWLISEDIFIENVDSTYKIHRKLNVRQDVENPFDEFVSLIKKHHISPERMASLERKKRVLDKYAYGKYLEGQQLLPKSKKTQRGNLGEILLGEYLEKVTPNRLFIYRLRYNTNVEQSMKGDDVLLLNKEAPFSKVYTGEAKFRTTPNQQVVNDICDDYGKSIVRPLSLGFTIELFYGMGKIEEAEILEELLDKVAKSEVEIINIGLLLSNHNTARIIDTHMKSKNKNFGIISLSMMDPAIFADISYDRAFKNLGVDTDD
ncbi:Hachiman antiphage defense system protein HamA [Lysinibacillus sp. FSL K6-0057]|uniref:Hachiman antiphage defense system protein HamA n=1 Tax=Lysinibacillus sp. FSL K6-0057 TaxID=2921411 RepID=UPI00315AE964